MPASTAFFGQRNAQAVLKHGVLARYAYYFAGRAGAATQGRVAFIDGYAGEGRYEDGSPGSPLLLASQATRAKMFGRDVRLAFVYEDVLVVRVHELVEREVWRRRYRHIRDFERMLADEGTTIIKFFLHISKDEQRARLQSRIDEPSKNWKFSVADLKERELWDDYQEAFADMLSETSTGWAPWTVVPADKKWYRNLVVASTVVDRLDQLGLAFPDNPEDISTIEVE